MSKKNKKYGFPYDLARAKLLHKFVNPKLNKTMSFYIEGINYFAVETCNEHQQRVPLDDVMFGRMLGAMDKYGWDEVKV
jgi:hypothetical protein